MPAWPVSRGPGSCLVASRLPDAASVERMRTEWRDRLAELRTRLESEDAPGS